MHCMSNQRRTLIWDNNYADHVWQTVQRGRLCSPVSDDAVLNRVLEGEDATLGLSLIAHVCILLAHANHDACWQKKTLMQVASASGNSSHLAPTR